MKYKVELETGAIRELASLSREIQHRLATAVNDLERNPRPPGTKKLMGEEGYRIRKGDYRILYTIDDHLKLVRVYRLGHRREVYR